MGRFPSILPEDYQVPVGYLVSDGVYKDGETGARLISIYPFFVKARIYHPERGSFYYQVAVLDGSEEKAIFVPSDKGPKGIIRAVNRTGVFLRFGEACKYIEEFLALNFRKLPVLNLNEDEVENLGDLELEACSVYELFLDFILAHEEEFAEQKFGKFLDGGTAVAVRQYVMNRFFEEAGVGNKQNVLRYWKQKGLLITNGNGKHLSKVVRFDGMLQRVYVVRIKTAEAESGDCQAEGIKEGDTVTLLDVSTGEKLTVTLLDPLNIKRGDPELGKKKVSVKSPLGEALSGKVVGESVTVKVNGCVTVYRVLEIVNYPGLSQKCKG